MSLVEWLLKQEEKLMEDKNENNSSFCVITLCAK